MILLALLIVLVLVAATGLAAGFCSMNRVRSERERQERREMPATLEGGGSHLSVHRSD